MIPKINMNPKGRTQSEVKEEGRGKEESLASNSLRVVCVSNLSLVIGSAFHKSAFYSSLPHLYTYRSSCPEAPNPFPNLLYLKSNPFFSNQFRYLFLHEYFREPTHTSAQLDVSPPTVDLLPHILVCPLLMAPITSHLGLNYLRPY